MRPSLSKIEELRNEVIRYAVAGYQNHGMRGPKMTILPEFLEAVKALKDEMRNIEEDERNGVCRHPIAVACVINFSAGPIKEHDRFMRCFKCGSIEDRNGIWHSAQDVMEWSRA